MRKIILLLFAVLFLFSDTLTIYAGSSVKEVLKDLKDEFLKTHPNVNIKILTGNSGMLLKKLKTSKKADLYLPSDYEFVAKNLSLFSNYKSIGETQIVMFVKKGNPKHITSLKDLLRKDVFIGMADENSGIGLSEREVLINYGGKSFLEKVLAKSDNHLVSLGMIDHLVKGEADVQLNYKAFSKWPIYKDKLDIVEIPEKYAPKKPLLLAITTFSKNKELANEFLNFALSPKGQEIIKKWGFR